MAHRRFTQGTGPQGTRLPIWSPRRSTAEPRERRSRRRLRAILGGVILFAALGLSAVAWVARDLPRSHALTDRAVQESTKIYDRTGTTLLYEIGEVHRTRVKLADISPHVVHATIAAEDRDFYEHSGIALRGILRSLVRARPGRRLQGGSTITQQLVKNALLTPERTFSRKIREQLLALIVEQTYTKDEIMELYLNEIPYGANAYGVEAAARAYFGTTAKDLSVAQAALLAALPKAPTYYSPYGSHRDELLARQRWIIDSMVELGFLSRPEAETAKSVAFSFTARRESIIAPHFVFYVRELLEQEYGETLVGQGGLKVVTSLDMSLQRAAEDAITRQAPVNRTFGARNAALVAVHPKRGDILAMVGSVDYFDVENDGNVNVALRPRSPGSSFKPIVYAEAFRKGFTPNTVLADAPIDFAAAGKSYSPKNFDEKYRGPVTMRQALAMSLNVPAVQTLYLAGLEDSVALARRLGFTTLTDPQRYGLSLVLGGGEVRLLDEVSAYGVFATEGVLVPPRAILTITAPSGDTLFDGTTEEPKGEVVLETPIARLVTNVLSDNSARAPMFGARSPLQLGERPVAAKTGTAQEFRDGWTVGYTPSLVAGVWVGNNDNTPMKREPGVYTAAPIWQAFMTRALQGTTVESFNAPEDVKTGKEELDGKLPEMLVRYEADTDLAVPAACGFGLGAPKRFVEFRSILHRVQRTQPRGEPPSSPETDPQYGPWEAGIATWREKFNTEHPDDQTRYVDRLPDTPCEQFAERLEGRPSVLFTSPTAASIRRSPLKIAVAVEAPDRVTAVTFFVDGQKIAERHEEPWETLYRFNAATFGEKTLRVRATTEAGKSNEVRKKIRINTDTTLPFVELLSPRSRDTITPSAFPLRLLVKATDPSGIKEVRVLYTPAGTSQSILIGSATSPETGRPTRFTIRWESAPAPGTYELRARATDATGNSAQTSPLTITIP